ncbi:MAG: tetratricopeptide repeat protein [Oscillochloris sp.]|nr:tetratricopeptide repeat protein [Oscillochloris sp.]
MILFPFLLTLLLIALVAPAVGRAGTVTASAGLLASAQANPTDVEVRVAAIHAAEEAVQATNSAPLAIRRLATAYALDGQTERAIALLEKVYAREPRSPLIKADLVALYEQAGRDEQAGELLRLTGQSADSLAARGSQALAQGDTIQVMELYRQAELLGATLTSSRHYLASQVLNQEGDAAAAERELALAIEIDQGWATQEERFQAWVTWGICFTGRLSRNLHFRRSRTRSPSHPQQCRQPRRWLHFIVRGHWCLCNWPNLSRHLPIWSRRLRLLRIMPGPI